MSKKNPVDPTIAETILKKIETSGVSQYRLAKESGVSTPVISRFVSGQRTLTIETADKLCRVLGLKLVDFESQE
jgi:plasmid maintenance system antidote protein VapI